ncbi:hypothetical protein [Pseudarthrobacter sp. NamE5]|uniref:hypothetical protein n=1 Tax=Pseudarthrobacter sp. NamE5 TaxID=2576839 RepID=UPI00110A822F|nr:hypothetical protein [Pseudarthrobacter sp. NamE5]TLM80833.1 hypothetical protein FDW84_18475 [Pseudarthrobacter sp. NamE5]
MSFDGVEMQIFVDEFEKELEGQSDRGLVIVGAAGLDVVLEGLLSAYLNEEVRREEMFGPNGPLGEFSSRIEMAASLGLISKSERRELELVRRIRNKAAHEVNATLSTDSLRDLCMTLELGRRLYAPKVIPAAEFPGGTRGIPADFDDPRVVFPTVDLALPDATNPKSVFAASVRVLLRILVARTAAVPAKTCPPPDFVHPEEPLEKSMTKVSSQLEEAETVLEEMKRLRNQLKQNGRSVAEQEAEIADLEASSQQLKTMLHVADYSNEVIRRSRLSS